jgi:hypothetical protein
MEKQLIERYARYFGSICDISELGYVPSDTMLCKKYNIYEGAIYDGLEIGVIKKCSGGDYKIQFEINDSTIGRMFELKRDREKQECESKERIRVLKLIELDIESIITKHIDAIEIKIPAIKIPDTKAAIIKLPKRKKIVFEVKIFGKKIFEITEI